ncbi:MAG: universal stress protein [Candidatus Aminicenantes bacterium]|nr:universal stress protein [Candidatus Aminicenantes bacterium]NLH76636.1 universal stress protein [Acidobacteriota bacterium]
MTHPIKNVLWATDFSAESKEALAYASFFAKTFKAKLTALHVVPDFAPALYEAWPEAQAELAGKIEASKVSAKAQLEHMCAAQGVCADKIVVTEGSAAKVILKTAQKEGAGLIVVGRKGVSGHEQNLIGSVTHRILRGARVPVLVTKGTDGKLGDLTKILVPTDFSNDEDVERDHAWKLAKALGASLTFLYVMELFGHDFRLTDEMFSSVLKKLQARKKREHKAVEMREDVVKAVHGYEGIIEYADSKGFGLVVMSTTVRKLSRLFLGSTTEKVIAHSRVPVFAIPREK